jgi:hypothetical protein
MLLSFVNRTPRLKMHAPALLRVWLVGFGLFACGPRVNLTPLGDAARSVGTEYLYGPAESGAVLQTVDGEGEQPSEEQVEEVVIIEEDEEDESSDDLDVVVEAAEETDNEEPRKPSSQATVAGTYKGTDWVTITLPGFPEDEQVDDRARVVLAVLDKPERYSFAVLDTRTGDELCKILGSRNESIITFDEDQSCFAGILGVPVEASTYNGIATIDGASLTVTLGVELTVNTPNGELSGDLDYRFEGKK